MSGISSREHNNENKKLLPLWLINQAHPLGPQSVIHPSPGNHIAINRITLKGTGNSVVNPTLQSEYIVLVDAL